MGFLLSVPSNFIAGISGKYCFIVLLFINVNKKKFLEFFMSLKSLRNELAPTLVSFSVSSLVLSDGLDDLQLLQ